MVCRADAFEGILEVDRPWSNWAGTVGYRISEYSEPISLASVVEVVARAQSEGRTVRAVGSGWAFEDIATSTGSVISPRRLDARISSVIDGALSALTDSWRTVQADPNAPERLYHVGAGIEIAQLNADLAGLGLAMLTLGGANGQTLAGAISTSTHGSDIALPPLPDVVQAIHLIGVGGTEHWIERASAPITTDDRLRDVLPCADTVIWRDDALFNAALVSMGRFGVIYSFVIKVRPAFTLGEWTVEVPTAGVLDALSLGVDIGDFLDPLIAPPPGAGLLAEPPLDLGLDTSERPRFVEIVINAQDPSRCFVRRRWPTQGPDLHSVDEESWWCTHTGATAILLAGASALSVEAALLSAIPVIGVFLAAPLLARAADLELAAVSGHLTTGQALAEAVNAAWDSGLGAAVPHLNGLLLSERFKNSATTGRRGPAHLIMTGSRAGSQSDCYKAASIEVIFDATRPEYLTFLRLLTAAAPGFRQAGYISVRYSAASRATLSMHNVPSGHAVSIEVASLKGFQGNAAWMDFVENNAVALGGRPHWGQINRLSAGQVAGLYRDALVEWRRALYRINGASPEFTNRYTSRRGLEPLAPAAQGDDMQPGEVLGANAWITSANGRYRLVYQDDANLVLYRDPDGLALWDTRPLPGGTGVCIMQGDGNLVVYNGDGNAAWASNTDGNLGSRLVVQDDGNVVIYAPDGTALWATGTVRPLLPTGPLAAGDDMAPGELLTWNAAITSANGRFRLVYQDDANLVLYRNDGTALWDTRPLPGAMGVCIMQGDGNLVVYNADAAPVWASDTGVPGSRLVIQDDGNVVIYAPDGTAVWATGTDRPLLPTGPPAAGDDMQPGEVLTSNAAITSANGRFRLVYQDDTNLVLYRDPEGTALWDTRPQAGGVGVCIMQGDGNLVVYNADAAPVWASNTGVPGSRLVMQDDGNVVIYAPDGTAVWDTGTWGRLPPSGPVAQGDDMQPGEVLTPNAAITSANGRFRLIYQDDTNLVLYRDPEGTALWDTRPQAGGVGVCIMQGDGNLVVYNADAAPVWASDTGVPGSRLVMQDDGNVVIYAPDGTAVWDTGTWGRLPPSGPVAQGDDMQPGEVLTPNAAITSANGRFRLVYQDDTNLVLYRDPEGTALWDTRPQAGGVGVCIMQGDGNLVVYNADAAPVWASNTGVPGSRLVIQDDGNVVIYAPDGTAVWATGTDRPLLPTGPPAAGDDMAPGEVLTSNAAITSANGRFRLVYQDDTNLVLYRDPEGTALWDTRPQAGGVGVCIMQGDGNLVVYNADAAPVWASNTGVPGSRLVMQDDGNVVIYAPDGTAVWDTGTWGRLPPSGPVAQGDDMQPGEVLTPNAAITSANGRFRLVYQDDTNLVLYRDPEGTALWDTRPQAGGVGVCIMQGDGNLVVYNADAAPVWASNTGVPGSRLVIQDDGNVVIYAPDGTAVWATGTDRPLLPTGPPAAGDDMAPGEVLTSNAAITSANGRFRLVYQDDTNLVLYRDPEGTALWDTRPQAGGVGVCIMQGDGNLVVYNADAAPVWASNTGVPGSRLVIQDDGNLVIYAPDGTAVWDTGTFSPVPPSGPQAQGDDMQPGEVLTWNASITSANGRYRLVYQDDTNLVLYWNVDNQALWDIRPKPGGVGVCIMQGDGNLVVYNAAATPVWASNTGVPGSHLVVQDDGNVVIYAPDGAAVWDTGTFR